MTERSRTSSRTRARTPDPDAADIGPRVVDGTYFHGAQRFTYVVAGITKSTYAGWSIRARIVDGPDAGRYRTIDDPWNPAAGDLVVSTPGSQR